MISAAPLAATELVKIEQESAERRAVFDSDLSVLSDIYQPDVNLSVWNREIDPELKGEAEALMKSNPSFQKSLGVRGYEAHAALKFFFQIKDMVRCAPTWPGLSMHFPTCLISVKSAFG